MIRSILLSALVALVLPLAGCATSTPAAEASSPAGPFTEVIGVWTYTVASPGGGDEGTFTITGFPGAYEGEIIAQGQPIPLSDITHDGDALSFVFQVGNGPLVSCEGVVTDDAFEGTADAGPYGAFAMTATR